MFFCGNHLLSQTKKSYPNIVIEPLLSTHAAFYIDATFECVDFPANTVTSSTRQFELVSKQSSFNLKIKKSSKQTNGNKRRKIKECEG